MHRISANKDLFLLPERISFSKTDVHQPFCTSIVHFFFFQASQIRARSPLLADCSTDFNLNFQALTKCKPMPIYSIISQCKLWERL